MCAFATVVLEKTRHVVAYRGYRWEVDVYHDDFDGLVIAEIELTHESDQPPLPAWLGMEITGNAAYSNRSIAAFQSKSKIGSKSTAMSNDPRDQTALHWNAGAES